MAFYDTTPSYRSGATMDAPDRKVRRIQEKQAAGAALRDDEYDRLAERKRLEAANARTGGTMKGTVQPRRYSAFDEGARDAQDRADYAAGAKSIKKPGLVEPLDPMTGKPVPPEMLVPAQADAPDSSTRPEAPPIPGANGDSSSAPAAPIAPRTPSMPAMAAGGAVQPRRFNAPQTLKSSVAPMVAQTDRDSFIGAGGRYGADFATRKSADTFANYAKRVTDEDEQQQIAAKRYPKRRPASA